MSPDHAIDLDLHLELIEPIRGYLRTQDGGIRSFTGWLEFNAALQRLTEEAARRSAGPSSTEGTISGTEMEDQCGG
jgi:hypothetical protein